MTPVVKSWNGVPGNGFNPSKTSSPQQFSNENIVTKTYPEIKIKIMYILNMFFQNIICSLITGSNIEINLIKITQKNNIYT